MGNHVFVLVKLVQYLIRIVFMSGCKNHNFKNLTH